MRHWRLKLVGQNIQSRGVPIPVVGSAAAGGLGATFTDGGLNQFSVLAGST
jgi:hypothetical protein